MPSAVIHSVYSYPALRLAPQQVHQRYVHPGPLVLGANPLNSPTPTADRDQTVSRRFEPSSRTTLIGEQPNPWDLLQPQDVMSRHRGAKHSRRYGLLGSISLLSPAYLLSVERWPTHAGPPDHYDRLSSLLDLLVSQSGWLMPLHSNDRFPTSIRRSATLAGLAQSVARSDQSEELGADVLARARRTALRGPRGARYCRGPLTKSADAEPTAKASAASAKSVR